MIEASATAAWIGFASGIIAGAISVMVAVYQARTDKRMAEYEKEVNTRLEKVKTELAAELHRRQALIDRELNAEDVLARYREPLAAAAFDLQSRLYNILRLNFFGKFGRAGTRQEAAVRTTLFRLAQYFGWSEILRRDIQFLSFPEAEETRRVASLQAEVARAFLTDVYSHAMMIWADEQRALGELMITEEHGKVIPMGYAAFEKHCNDDLQPWLERVRTEVVQTRASARLRTVQHLLCELVETLDKNRLRYEERDLRRA